jgi:hypothetical protein
MTIELVLSDKARLRFWSRVTLPNEDGCMLWTGAVNSRGYGHGKFDGAFRTAHRVSLHLAIGAPGAEDLQTAHSCRNRNCVAPAHLRWATAAENQNDRFRDGTDDTGERAYNAKLTDEQADSIRREFAAGGTTYPALAAKYSVSRMLIGTVIRGTRYAPKAGVR